MLENVFKSVRDASRKLPLLSDAEINRILISLADKAIEMIPAIIRENEKDLARMPETDPKYDRLKLTDDRIRDIAKICAMFLCCPLLLESRWKTKPWKIDCSWKRLRYR